ncbi:MAG: hypothetical protein M1828_005181 [Chrysothrix sp. TS-e1954]|nr:MAG: hypothetical protein M1828_005181 [Chrysothrix sp. TS-e1954]
MAQSKRHALVFGASGVSGWAIVKELLKYPTGDTFNLVTGLTNRPLSLSDSSLPADPRLQLASAIDLTSSVDSVVAALKQKVKSVETVTHVFFTAYIEKPDFQSLKAVNVDLCKTAISAIDQISPNIQAVILQTGGKGYGVEFTDKLSIAPPLKESAPRIPKPYYDNIFYYGQHDILKDMSSTRSWTFSEVIPDVIIGFTPGTNFMNCAQGLGLWLSLVREIEDQGAKVPFPGTDKSWLCKHTDSSQDILARSEIHIALHRDTCMNASQFNSADGAVVTWSDKWPGICKYFGLQGTLPGSEPYSIEAWVKSNQQAWQALAQKHNLRQGIFENFSWPFLYFVMTAFDFDRHYDLSALRSTGFTESLDTVGGYTTAFDRMSAAKIIP